MKKENSKLSEMNLDSLIAKKKAIKAAAIGLGTVMLLAASVLFYLVLTTTNYALITVAIGYMVTFAPIFVSLVQINDEIKSRLSK